MTLPSAADLRRFLEGGGLLSESVATTASSPLTFPDGRRYHVEIPSVEGPEALRTVFEAADAHGIRVDRVSQGSGIMLQTDDEIREMVELGRSRSVEVCLFVGPRAEWDIGLQASTPDGHSASGAVRGDEQLRYAVEDVRHGCELGLRCVLVADFGLLWVLGRMRTAGLLPEDLRFKVSASSPVTNPATARLLQELGADTINVSADLTISQLAAMRAAIDVPIDLYIEAPDGFGAALRYYDVPAIVRVAAPVHLKFAVRNAASLYPYGRHLRQHALDTARERVRRAALAIQILDRSDPLEPGLVDTVPGPVDVETAAP